MRICRCLGEFRGLLVVLLLSFTMVQLSSAQPNFRIPLTMRDSSATVYSVVSYFGVNPNATNCIDLNTMTGFTDHWADIFILGTQYSDSMQEVELPPPGESIDLRIQSIFPATCRQPLYANIQAFTSASQIDSFTIVPQPYDGTSPHPLIYSVPAVIGEYCDSLVVIGSKFDQDANFGAGQLFNYHVDLVKTNGRFADIPTNPDMVLLGSFKLFMYHPKVGPGAPATLALVSPPNGDSGDSLVTVLSWTAPALADSYRVQIATDTTFAVPLVDRTTTQTTINTPQLNSTTTYFWRVEVYNKYGISYYQDPPWNFTTKTVSGVGPDRPGLPGTFSLSQNYPNPFNPSTRIDFTLPAAGHVRLKVYNLFGEEVRTLLDGMQFAGTHHVLFDGSNLPSGVYIYRLIAGHFSGSGRMALVK